MSTTLAQTAAHLDRRRAAAEAELAARAAAVRASLPAVATCLLGEFGATGACVFGSFATGQLHAESDLDIAVAGLPPELHFAALAALSRIVDVPVDLVRLEDASPRLRARIELEGLPLAR